MSNIEFKDKFLCAICYLGSFIPLLAWFPLIWLVINNVRKVYVKEFVRYHCYQSILFNMIILFLPSLFRLLTDFLINLLDLMVIFANTIVLIKALQGFVLKIYFFAIPILSLYAVIWTFRGKYTYLPPISQAVNSLLR